MTVWSLGVSLTLFRPNRPTPGHDLAHRSYVLMWILVVRYLFFNQSLVKALLCRQSVCLSVCVYINTSVCMRASDECRFLYFVFCVPKMEPRVYEENAVTRTNTSLAWVKVIIDILQCVVTECIYSNVVVVVDLARLRVRVRARVWV